MAFVVRLASNWDVAGWRHAARTLVRAEIAPHDVVWKTSESPIDLLSTQVLDLPVPGAQRDLTVPRRFLDTAETAAIHSDPERFALLYECLWRLRSERALMEVAVDPLVARLEEMAKSVRRDIHKMHAFVRFREVATDTGAHFVAWFEPEHFTVEAGSPFFQRRFAAMRWSIMTPFQCAHWDGAALVFDEGLPRPDMRNDDVAETLWRSYYASIFNPARLKVSAMCAEMPRKYWRNLPEASLIKPLIEGAAQRTQAMVVATPTPPKSNPQMLLADDKSADAALIGKASDLAALRAEAAGCRACSLWEPATQTVFGEGPENADIVFVGEQPGDQEDIAGKPFVGPAGQLLDRAMAEAGIDRKRVYVTNAVKHFKFEPRGKRRLHKKPNTGEIQKCRWWLGREIATVRPKLVVALGATAVQSVLKDSTSITKLRGRFMPYGDDAEVFVTVHPSYLLRLPDESAKASEYARFVADLKSIGQRQAAGFTPAAAPPAAEP